MNSHAVYHKKSTFSVQTPRALQRSGQSLAIIEAAAIYWHNNELFVQRVAELNGKRVGVLAFAQERGARSAGRVGRPGTARAVGDLLLAPNYL